MTSTNCVYSYNFIGALTTSTIAIFTIYLISKYKRNVFSGDSRSQKSSVQSETKQKLRNEIIAEVCVSDIESIINAKHGNADSVEICCDREQGGITPSIGLVQHAVYLLRDSNTEVHVLIRPRSGNFCYSNNEFDVMLRDIILVKQAGADGVVVGVLDANGYIDRYRLKVLRECCKGISMTFHRAYDVCELPEVALETIIAVGCDRLLTSGRAKSAGSKQGLEQLKQLTKQANNRIKIIAAGGVNATNVDDIFSYSGVQGIHAGSSVTCMYSNNSDFQHNTTASHLTHNHKDNSDHIFNRCNQTSDINQNSESEILIAPSSKVSIGLNENENLDKWSVVSVNLVQELVDAVTSSTQNKNNSSWRDISENDNSIIR